MLFRLYYASVLALAALLAGGAWAHHPLPQLPVVLGALALLVLAESAPVRLPGGGQMTAGTMIDLPVLLMIGPFWTAAVDAAAAVIVQGVFQRRPFVREIGRAHV